MNIYVEENIIRPKISKNGKILASPIYSLNRNGEIMFFIYNKDKIISVIIAFSTVFVLFFVAGVIRKNNTVETAIGEAKLLPIYSVDTNEKKVALTINCAWTAEDVDLILETLENHNTKITFFMVGEWVGKYQEEVKKINEAGHEIANHSYSHPHVNNLSFEKNKEEITRCSKLIKQLTGKDTVLYRGPYGEYNNTVINAAEELNHKVVQWNIDSLDWKGLTGEQMWERINKKLDNGSIILMHNGTENTALSLDIILTNIEEKGFKVVKVSDLIYPDNYIVDNNGVQKKYN